MDYVFPLQLGRSAISPLARQNRSSTSFNSHSFSAKHLRSFSCRIRHAANVSGPQRLRDCHHTQRSLFTVNSAHARESFNPQLLLSKLVVLFHCAQNMHEGSRSKWPHDVSYSSAVETVCNCLKSYVQGRVGSGSTLLCDTVVGIG